MYCFRYFRLSSSALLILVASLSELLVIGYATAACDNTGAGSNVGACASGVTTCTNVDQSSCKTPILTPSTNPKYYYAVNVMEDFPTKCVESTGNNCNTPDAPCTEPCYCKWENGKCIYASGSGVWGKIDKRETKQCDTGG